jgi:predicted permease
MFRGMTSRNVDGASSMLSYPEYLEYRDNNHVFSGLLAYQPYFGASLAGEQPRHVQGQFVSCNYFQVLEVRPVLGERFTEADCAADGTTPVVILSAGLWHSAFDADPSVLGKTITLNRVSLTVVGVAPPGFRGTDVLSADFWVPVTMQPALDVANKNHLADSNLSWLVAMGRLKPGTSLAQARADLSVVAGRIDQGHPGRKTTLTIEVASIFGEPEARAVVLGVGAVILGAVTLVLLIACANVANLLLAGASTRRKEIAVRLAMGASRFRLVRQLMTESLLLALIGGALGSVLSFWSFHALFQFIVAHVPLTLPVITVDARPDLQVLAYALALTLSTGVLFGLTPALQASNPDLILALKNEGSGSHSTGARSKLRSALVVAQVSVCLVLLLAAGLLARGLREAQIIDPGFSAENVCVTALDLKEQGYDGVRARLFQQRLTERIATLPGVDGVAQATVIPLSLNDWGSGIRINGNDRIQIHFDEVSPAYFPLLNIPIIRGRNFTDAETRSAAKVAIAMDSTARRLWPNEDPVGKVFGFQSGPETWTTMQVIGVVKNTRASSLGADDDYFFYFLPAPEDHAGLNLLVRNAGSFAATAKEIREAVRSLDPNVLAEVHALQDNLENYRWPSRMVTILSSTLGGLALLLASIGVYSVVAYMVSHRTREIGIRMTLGANALDVLRLVLGGSMRPVVLGIVIGVAGCAAVSRLLSSLLFGVSPFDPVIFTAVPAFFLAVALLASYLPARRAIRVDPAVALRYE